MCIINIDGSAVNYTEGMTYIDAIRAANPERADGALARIHLVHGQQKYKPQ